MPPMSKAASENQQLSASLVITSLPDDESFEALARSLLSQGLVACATALPGARSMYRWKGKIADDREVLALLKTRRDLVSPLTAAISKMHPYELPEVIEVPVNGGLEAYLDWIAASTTHTPHDDQDC